MKLSYDRPSRSIYEQTAPRTEDKRSCGAETTTLTYFWAALLGLVQGLTEFLPVPSSGHLALVEHLGMGMPADPLFDVLLHIATLIVVIVYFSKSVVWYFRHDRVVLWYVVIASVPNGLIGVLAKDYF